MKVGFHIWEVCYDEKTWEYGNKLAGLYSIIIGIVLFEIIYPILIYLEVKRSYLVGLIILFVFLYLILIYFTVKIKVRKKFNLKDK